MTLVRQEGRALHEEDGERAEREISHGIGRVSSLPLVRQSLAATAQGIEKAILDRHRSVESRNAACGKQVFA